MRKLRKYNNIHVIHDPSANRRWFCLKNLSYTRNTHSKHGRFRASVTVSSLVQGAVERVTGILTEVDSYDWITFLPMADGSRSLQPLLWTAGTQAR